MATGSGTGTIAVASHAVTAGALIDEVRAALDDAAGTAWSDAELLGFMAEAVREYSQHLPRMSEVTLAAEAGETRYPLPWDATAVISVEYATGDGSPIYLHRRGRRSARFAAGRYYDVVWTRDLTEAPALLLGFAPEPAASLVVGYLRPHESDLAADTNLTVPAEHYHVLLQYVLFAAARQLQAREQAAPTNNSSLLMAQLASNTRRLELGYLNALNRILYQRMGEGEMVSWE